MLKLFCIGVFVCFAAAAVSAPGGRHVEVDDSGEIGVRRAMSSPVARELGGDGKAGVRRGRPKEEGTKRQVHHTGAVMDDVEGKWLDAESARKLSERCRSPRALVQTCTEESLPTFDAALEPMKEAFRNHSLQMPLSENSIHGASHHGFENWYRLHHKMQKLLDKKGLNVLVIGGSVTAYGNWTQLLTKLLQRTYRGYGPVSVHNKAIGASSHEVVLAKIAELHKQVGPVDLVISEYHFNEFVDDHGGIWLGSSKEARTNRFYKATKQLMSIVMSWPTEPAFMFLDIPKWFNVELKGEPTETKSLDWLQAPAIASGHWWIANEFRVPLVWYSEAVRESGSLNMPEEDHECHPGKKCLPWAHPANFPGHYVMASLVFGLLHRELLHVCKNGVLGADSSSTVTLSAADTAMTQCYANPLRQAFASNNRESFQVDAGTAWRFFEDVQGKPGWIAESGAPKEIVFKSVPVKRGLVKLGYLRSYEGLGNLECQLEGSKGASLKVRMQGLWESCSSQIDFAHFNNVTAGTYDIRCLSDGQKFKIVSVLSC